MANNYVLLSSTVLQSTVSSVTFSNIPTTGYTNLKIYISARSTRSNPSDTLFTRLNGDSNTALYDYTQLYGYANSGLTGTGSGPQAGLFTAIPSATMTANYFSAVEIEVFGYTASEFKPVRVSDASMGDGSTTWQIDDVSMLYKSNSAVTSITFVGDLGNLIAGSTFAIYGLANANQTPASPKATGGNIVTNDGTYWYHTFLSSGTFTPNQNITCDYLVVAGGGGWNTADITGGGGGGGLRCTVGATGGGGSVESPIAVTAQNYAIIVGAGGSNSNGSNSVFSTITSDGGGKPGGFQTNGSTGGSGGGSGAFLNGLTGGAGTTNQGRAGGNSQFFGGGTTVEQAAGGGGGANTIGSNAVSGTGGNGGAGVTTSISGTSTTYAGGGGGWGGTNPSTGGSGGGGNGYGGSGSVAGSNGTANTGGGAGGGRASNNGGSGIVIIRYSVA
jgi:hypothetical protein